MLTSCNMARTSSRSCPVAILTMANCDSTVASSALACRRRFERMLRSWRDYQAQELYGFANGHHFLPDAAIDRLAEATLVEGQQLTELSQLSGFLRPLVTLEWIVTYGGMLLRIIATVSAEIHPECDPEIICDSGSVATNRKFVEGDYPGAFRKSNRT